MRRKRNSNGWIALAGLAAIGCGVVWAQTGNRSGANNSSAASSAEQPAPDVEVSEVSVRKPLDYYMKGIRGSLFSAAPAAPIASAPKPTLPLAPLPAAPEKIDPFNDYAYSGTVTVDGDPVALVENSKTREGLFLKKGESFLGGTVGDITDRSLKVTIAGVERMMAKTDNFKLTPLDKSAGYLTPAAPGAPGAGPGTAAAPGAPGQPGSFGAFQFPGMGGGGGDFMNRMRERMEAMTPEQREEARNRFMNRSFERRGDGGRRGSFRDRVGGGGFGF
jgi:hypothetical protein